MNDDNFKKLVAESLKTLTQKVDTLTSELKDVKGTQNNKVLPKVQALASDLKEVKDTQEKQVLPSVITTESIIKGYADAYKTNKANIIRLDTRVTGLEDRAGITSSPDFAIQR